MKSWDISRSKIGPFSLACTDPYIGIGWEYQSSPVLDPNPVLWGLSRDPGVHYNGYLLNNIIIFLWNILLCEYKIFENYLKFETLVTF